MHAPGTGHGPCDSGSCGESGRLRAWIRLEDEIERRLGRVLHRMGRCGAWHELRFSGPGHYARERLGMGRTTAEARVRLARSLDDRPALRSAYEEGRLGVEATLLVRRVLCAGRADEATERAWVEHAEEVTVRRLRDEVRPYRHAPVAVPGGGPPLDAPPSDAEWYASLERGPGRSTARHGSLPRGLDVLGAPDVLLSFHLPLDVAGSFRDAIGAACAELEGEIASGHEGTAPSQLAAQTFSDCSGPGSLDSC